MLTFCPLVQLPSGEVQLLLLGWIGRRGLLISATTFEQELLLHLKSALKVTTAPQVSAFAPSLLMVQLATVPKEVFWKMLQGTLTLMAVNTNSRPKEIVFNISRFIIMPKLLSFINPPIKIQQMDPIEPPPSSPLQTGNQQSQTLNNLSPQQSSDHPPPPSEEEEWSQLRQQYFQKDESIKQGQQIIETISKWIQLKYQSQMEQYFKTLRTYKQYNSSNDLQLLEVFIGNAISEAKLSDWKISQKYDIKQINTIVAALKDLLGKAIKQQEEKELLEEKKLLEEKELMKQKKRKSRQANLYDVQEGFPVGKLSSSNNKSQEESQLKNVFHNLEKIKPLKAQSTLNRGIFRNPFLKKTFTHFCKQNYRTGFTFDESSTAVDKMNRNKWMVFCKEFDFIRKFSQKEMLEVYNVCCQFGPHMNVEQFLHGVALIEQKYITKYHIVSDTFLSDIMQLTSETSFRIRMANLKISYAGPTKNFFQQGNYTEQTRREEKQLQAKFKTARKQREMVLIKGMYESHQEHQLKSLKLKREQRKHDLMTNRSMVQPREGILNPEKATTQRTQNLNYSKLFHLKAELGKPKYTMNLKNNSFFKEDKTNKISTNRSIREEITTTPLSKQIPIPTKTKHAKQQQPDTQTEYLSPRRDWLQTKNNNQSMWFTNIRNDSEQSDEILKEHLDNEKRISHLNSNHSQRLNPLHQYSSKVEAFRKQIEEEKQHSQEDEEIGIEEGVGRTSIHPKHPQDFTLLRGQQDRHKDRGSWLKY